jgi:hypothetical protein
MDFFTSYQAALRSLPSQAALQARFNTAIGISNAIGSALRNNNRGAYERAIDANQRFVAQLQNPNSIYNRR